METPSTKPWIVLLDAQRRFLGDVDSINFMHNFICPILKDWEVGRMDLLQQMSKEVKTENKTYLEPKSPEYHHEWLRHRHMLGKAERFFRNNNLVSLVSRFDEFVSVLLRVAIGSNKEEWLASNDKKLTYKQVFELASVDAWKELLVEEEVDRLMRGSHLDQLTYLDTKLKCGVIDKFGDGIKEFLEVTERRNLFVHTGGIVSSQYLANCKRWNISLKDTIKEGSLLGVPKTYLRAASICFVELSLRLVQALVRRLYPSGKADADYALNFQGVDFLDREVWGMAERTFRFALEIDPKHRSKGPWLLQARINLCTALKSAGKKFDRELGEVDWSNMHPQYQLAEAVLQDRLDDVFRLMQSPAVVDEIKEEGFVSWPLFKKLRSDEQFKTIFKKLFKKDLPSGLEHGQGSDSDDDGTMPS